MTVEDEVMIFMQFNTTITTLHRAVEMK